MGERDNPDEKSTEFDDLPPNKEDLSGIKGGAAPPKPIKKPMCPSTGGMSTCTVDDTTVNVCDTLSGCK